jgi:hypothetical protein
MALFDEEDAPPMEKPKGVLSVGAEPLLGLGARSDDGEDDYSDKETVHAESIMEAFKSGNTEELRDSLAAFTRECIRNFNKGKSGE